MVRATPWMLPLLAFSLIGIVSACSPSDPDISDSDAIEITVSVECEDGGYRQELQSHWDRTARFSDGSESKAALHRTIEILSNCPETI
jgi:hypothetical protein